MATRCAELREHGADKGRHAGMRAPIIREFHRFIPKIADVAAESVRPRHGAQMSGAAERVWRIARRPTELMVDNA
jgi:hypothetical protein